MIRRCAPLVRELVPCPDAARTFHRLASLPHCLFLDSSLRHATLGQYSFLTADPFDFQWLDAGGMAAALPDIPSRRGQEGWPTGPAGLREVQDRLMRWSTPRIEGLPPFQGGAAGCFGYELGRGLERLPAPEFDDFQVPAMALGWYDVVVAWDHSAGRAWIISQGLPEVDPDQRMARAEARAEQMLRWMEQDTDSGKPRQASLDIGGPLHPASPSGVYSNFTARQYRDAVAQAIEWIGRGDAFQVNLSQRLLKRFQDDPRLTYQRLRHLSPATFAGFFDLGPYQLLTISPERFWQVRAGLVEARPIKGTRREWGRAEADLFAQSDLAQSAKDQSENVMIVDLMRNDLSRVCEADSIHVPVLCGLESYGYVHHLVSAVQGRLRAHADVVDLLRCTFPSGSVTGAPKIRAMEIITELERVARGAYCGGLGYLSVTGDADLNVLIRSMTIGGGWCQFPVGGGIVATSDPEQELQETWHKAAGMLPVLC